MPAEPEPFNFEMTYTLNLQSRDQVATTRSDDSMLQHIGYVTTQRYLYFGVYVWHAQHEALSSDSESRNTDLASSLAGTGEIIHHSMADI